MDLMIDIETLGTRPDSVIMTVGAVLFDPEDSSRGQKIVCIRPRIDEQISMGRSIEHPTLEWWSTQNPKIWRDAICAADRTGVRNSLSVLGDFADGADLIWAYGPQFDIVMLESLYRQTGERPPWDYHQIRDCRTVTGLLENMLMEDMPADERDDAHDAVADCRYQIKCLKRAYRLLGFIGRTEDTI